MYFKWIKRSLRGENMNIYYVWIGTFDESNFEQYWDNEPYENAMKLWTCGNGLKPSEYLKCGFCREMGLEELDKKDYWFSVSGSLRTGRELAKDYIPIDLDAFEKICAEKCIWEGNVIWGISVKDFPNITPTICKSMTYIGEIAFQ